MLIAINIPSSVFALSTISRRRCPRLVRGREKRLQFFLQIEKHVLRKIASIFEEKQIRLFRFKTNYL